MKTHLSKNMQNKRKGKLKIPNLSDNELKQRSQDSFHIILRYQQQHNLKVHDYVRNFRYFYDSGIISKKLFKALLSVAAKKDNTFTKNFSEFLELERAVDAFSDANIDFTAELRRRLKELNNG